MPFLDTGGVVAADTATAEALVQAALELTAESNSRRLEFRNFSTPSADGMCSTLKQLLDVNGRFASYHSYTIRHKVRMMLKLQDTADELLKSFKAKLRSQIKKPIRDGVTVEIGGQELIEDFYHVFSVNMRDLGSPVHSKVFITSFLASLEGMAHVLVAYHQGIPLAGSIIVGYGETIYNPWASSLRMYKRLNANMLLYWTMLEFGCNHGFRYFDFGRSTPNEGTYRFKSQWGAQPHPLEWTVIQRGEQPSEQPHDEKQSFSFAIQCWQKLPVGLTRWLGPKIRKHISL